MEEVPLLVCGTVCGGFRGDEGCGVVLVCLEGVVRLTDGRCLPGLGDEDVRGGTDGRGGTLVDTYGEVGHDVVEVQIVFRALG